MKRLLVLAFVFLMMVGCKKCQECQCGDDTNYTIFEVCRDNFKSNDDYKAEIKRWEIEGLRDSSYIFKPCECKPDILW